MAAQALNLGTLQDLDGASICKAFDKAVAQAIADCRDNPTDERTRKVTLILAFEPVPPKDDDEERETRLFDVAFDVRCTVPGRRILPLRAKLDGKGRLIVNDISPDNPDQGTLA